MERRNGIWLAALLATGCATTGRPAVSDEQLARVPAAERRAILEQETDVRVAETNEAAALAGRRDAERFVDIAKREVSAATSRLEAADSSLKLARTTRDRAMREEARRELKLGRAQLRTARAKLTYASALLAFRRAEADRRRAEVDFARANLELRKLDTLRRYQEGMKEDRDQFVGARAKAGTRVEETARASEDKREAFAEARARWRAQRDELARVRAEVSGGTLSAPRAPRPVSPDR